MNASDTDIRSCAFYLNHLNHFIRRMRDAGVDVEARKDKALKMMSDECQYRHESWVAAMASVMEGALDGVSGDAYEMGCEMRDVCLGNLALREIERMK